MPETWLSESYYLSCTLEIYILYKQLVARRLSSNYEASKSNVCEHGFEGMLQQYIVVSITWTTSEMEENVYSRKTIIGTVSIFFISCYKQYLPLKGGWIVKKKIKKEKSRKIFTVPITKWFLCLEYFLSHRKRSVLAYSCRILKRKKKNEQKCFLHKHFKTPQWIRATTYTKLDSIILLDRILGNDWKDIWKKLSKCWAKTYSQ